MKNLSFIYLASKSQSRQALLKTSNIPFVVVSQNANEDKIEGSLQEVVKAIALEKMKGVILPSGKENGEVAFVLTSDTMGVDRNGEISVSMHRRDQELEMVIKDDGVGIADELDWKNTNTLGLKLVQTLVENQLDGSIEQESQNGTKFTIKFNIENS